MFNIKTSVLALSVFSFFLNPASASSLADGNASIGCNLQHGNDYKDQQEANDIVAYVTNVPQAKAVEVESETVE
jgi:hypothetical protein